MISPALLGLDPTCLARMDVPEARRLVGVGWWAISSIGAAAVAGGCLGWLAGAPVWAPIGAFGLGLFVWNLVRLFVAGVGAPTHRGEAAVKDWVPGWGGAVVLLLFGAVLGQPTLAVVAGLTHAAPLEAARAVLVSAHAQAVAAGLGSSASQAAIEHSPMFAARVNLTWGGPLGPLFTVFHALLVASPVLVRRGARVATRQYEEARVAAERRLVLAAWDRSERRITEILSVWPTFSGALRPVSNDPPFHDRPLLVGHALGLCVPFDAQVLRAALPGYDAACTAGGRRRAGERLRLSRQAEAAEAVVDAEPTHRGARFHLARTLLERADRIGPIDPAAARVDVARARALLDTLVAEGGAEAALHAGRAAACLRLGDLEHAAHAADALGRVAPGCLARRVAADILDVQAARAGSLGLHREALALLEPDGDDPRVRHAYGAACRAVARGLLPRGGPEASTLAERGLLVAESGGDPRTLAAALDLVSATNPSLAPAARSRALTLMAAVWQDDPTPRHTLDYASLLASVAGRSADPHTAALDTRRAQALVEQVRACNPEDLRAQQVAVAVAELRMPPLLPENLAGVAWLDG